MYKKGDKFVIELGEEAPEGGFLVKGTRKRLLDHHLDKLVKVEERTLDAIGVKSSRRVFREDYDR